MINTPDGAKSERRPPVRRRRRILVRILAGAAVLGLTFVLGLSAVGLVVGTRRCRHRRPTVVRQPAANFF
jgi:hypothetical protein